MPGFLFLMSGSLRVSSQGSEAGEKQYFSSPSCLQWQDDGYRKKVKNKVNEKMSKIIFPF